MSRAYRFLLVLVALLMVTSILACDLATTTRARSTPTPIVIVITATPPPSAIVVAQAMTPTPSATFTTVPPTPTQSPTMTPTVAPSPTPRAFRDTQEELLISIYERVSPSVVFVISELYYYDRFFGRQTQTGSGSGFVIDQQGHIVTNNHVIEGATSVEVRLSDHTTVAAEVIGADPLNDLAVLKIEVSPDKLKPVELASSANLRVGQLAVAIGNPLGLEQSLSVGVVSALGRQLSGEGSESALYDVIQTDAAINPGNSGGPLLNSQGQVIGVNSAIPNVTGASIGIGFAVPVDTVKRVVPALIQNGHYPHPWLGFTGFSLTPGFAELLNLSENSGILVVVLSEGGPAAQAGVRGPSRTVSLRGQRIPVGGDIVVALDGTMVSDMDQVTQYLEKNKKIGDTVVLTLVRDGRRMDVRVTLGELPRS